MIWFDSKCLLFPLVFIEVISTCEIIVQVLIVCYEITLFWPFYTMEYIETNLKKLNLKCLMRFISVCFVFLSFFSIDHEKNAKTRVIIFLFYICSKWIFLLQNIATMKIIARFKEIKYFYTKFNASILLNIYVYKIQFSGIAAYLSNLILFQIPICKYNRVNWPATQIDLKRLWSRQNLIKFIYHSFFI